jgi:hypothetical protein
LCGKLGFNELHSPSHYVVCGTKTSPLQQQTMPMNLKIESAWVIVWSSPLSYSTVAFHFFSRKFSAHVFHIMFFVFLHLLRTSNAPIDVTDVLVTYSSRLYHVSIVENWKALSEADRDSVTVIDRKKAFRVDSITDFDVIEAKKGESS